VASTDVLGQQILSTGWEYESSLGQEKRERIEWLKKCNAARSADETQAHRKRVKAAARIHLVMLIQLDFRSLFL
jgi:hypothetical protein